MHPTGPSFAVAGAMLVALCVAVPTDVAAGVHPSSVPASCRIVLHAPVHRGGAPGKTTASMTFTCTRSYVQAVASVQSQELIRGRWIHQATRTITFFQVKTGRRYAATTPPIDCSPGEYRAIASVKAGSRITHAQSAAIEITCA